jgi:hypothetical protein
MEDISKPQIEIVEFHLKCCIAAGVSKISLSGRKIGGSGVSITPIKNLESCWSEIRMN